VINKTLKIMPNANNPDYAVVISSSINAFGKKTHVLKLYSEKS
jgi:hypothetical protein